MRLYELKSTQITHADVAKRIATECSNILELYKRTQHVLYRGTRGKHPTIFKSASIANRHPSDTPKLVQRKFDKMLTALGFKAIRSNSIFTNPAKMNALEYTDDDEGLYVIFPVNGFDYTWSKDVGDLFGHFAGTTLEKWILRTNITRQSLKKFQELFRYSNQNLEQALLDFNEVMIKGQFYAIDEIEWELLEQLLGFVPGSKAHRKTDNAIERN